MAEITRERAERIARSHACETCKEYSYKKVTAKPASDAHREQFSIQWQVVAICGICGRQMDLGIDEDGDIVYAG